jgi:peptidoglycan/LPS O-acetylase OafA/YrhL
VWATFFHEAIIVLCGATLLIALEGGVSFLRWKALTYTGLISYGLYLIHNPLNWAMHTAFHWNNPKDVRLAAVSFVLVYLIAVLSWEWFEKPFVRFGHRFRYNEEDPVIRTAWQEDFRR